MLKFTGVALTMAVLLFGAVIAGADEFVPPSDHPGYVDFDATPLLNGQPLLGDILLPEPLIVSSIASAEKTNPEAAEILKSTKFIRSQAFKGEFDQGAVEAKIEETLAVLQEQGWTVADQVWCEVARFYGPSDKEDPATAAATYVRGAMKLDQNGRVIGIACFVAKPGLLGYANIGCDVAPSMVSKLWLAGPAIGASQGR